MSKAAHPTWELSPQQHCLSIPGAPTSGLTSSPLHDLLIVADPPSPENLLHLLTCSSCTINLIRLVPSSKYQVPFLFPCCCCCCCCSVTKSCLTLCDPMDCSTPGFLVLHYLLEFAQTHVHWVNDAIQTSHLLLPPSPPALNLSQHQGLFQWANSVSGGQSIGLSASASVLPVNIQGWFPSELTGLISLLSKGVSRVFSSITIQKYQFFSTQPSLWSNSHIRTWLLEKL